MFGAAIGLFLWFGLSLEIEIKGILGLAAEMCFHLYSSLQLTAF